MCNPFESICHSLIRFSTQFRSAVCGGFSQKLSFANEIQNLWFADANRFTSNKSYWERLKITFIGLFSFSILNWLWRDRNTSSLILLNGLEALDISLRITSSTRSIYAIRIHFRHVENVQLNETISAALYNNSVYNGALACVCDAKLETIRVIDLARDHHTQSFYIQAMLLTWSVWEFAAYAIWWTVTIERHT